MINERYKLQNNLQCLKCGAKLSPMTIDNEDGIVYECECGKIYIVNDNGSLISLN